MLTKDASKWKRLFLFCQVNNNMKTHRPVFESEKPRIVKNLESAFKNALWDADKPFDINDNDMHLLFDAINDGLF